MEKPRVGVVIDKNNIIIPAIDQPTVPMVHQGKWRSKLMWASLAGVVIPVLGHFGLYAKLGITQTDVQYAVDALFAVLQIVGVINNPNNREAL